MPTSQKPKRGISVPSDPVEPGTSRVTVNPGKKNERSFERSEAQPLIHALGSGMAKGAAEDLKNRKDK